MAEYSRFVDAIYAKEYNDNIKRKEKNVEMQKITSVEQLRCDLKDLSALITALDADLSRINHYIHTDRFIPEALGKKASEDLNKIDQLQKTIEQQFTLLEIGKLPEETAKTEEILAEYQKKLEAKEKYWAAAAFFLSLHSEDSGMEEKLEEKKEELQHMDLDSLDEPRLKELLHPYILLKHTYEETDTQKKFMLLYELPNYFDPAIFTGIGTGAIRSTQEEVCCAQPQGNDIQEEEEDLNSQDMETEPAAESLPVQSTAETHIITDAQEKEETEEKEEQPLMEDVRTSAPVTDEQEETRLPGSDAIKEQELWSQLGIEDITAVCHKEQPELLRAEMSSKAGDKFGVSKFKSDFTKQALKEKTACLVEALNGCAYTKESIAIYLNKEPGYYDFVTDKLYQLGYLKKYSVSGMGEFFTLSPRGEKAFSTKDSFTFLQKINWHTEKIDADGKTPIKDSTNAAVIRLLNCSCYARMRQLDSQYHFVTRLQTFDENSFLLTFQKVLKKFMIEYTGIVTEKAEQFDVLKKMIKSRHASVTPDYMIILEPDLELARQVARWIITFVNPEISVGYAAYNEDTVFDVSTDEVLEIIVEEKEEELDSFKEENREWEDDKEKYLAEAAEEASASIQENIEAESFAAESEMPLPDEPGIQEEAEETVPKADMEKTDRQIETPETQEKTETLETDTVIPLQDMEKPKTVPAVHEAALSETDRQNYTEAYQEMLASGKFYAAAAFLKSLSSQYPYFEPVYRQTAYALNDPMENCSYSSDTVMAVYYEEENPVSDYFVISAAVRDYFYDQFPYEYSLPQLQSMISASEVFREIHAVEEIAYTLQKFKTDYQAGMDRYADYREKEQALLEERLEKTRQEAKGYYDNYSSGNLKENASHKRFIETSKLLLGPKSEISEYLEIVISDNREMLELLEEFLKINYVKDQAAICEENIDPAKINRILDEYWDKAALNMRLVKKTSDLMSSLRMNLFKKVQKVISILCNYVFLCRSNVSDKDNPALMEYKRNRKTLLANIGEAVRILAENESDAVDIRAGKRVLQETLMEIQSRISGDYKEGSYKYFYMDFLKNDKVLLDENYFPVLDEVLELPDFSVRNRILKHCKETDAEKKSWEERIDDIYRKEDNYGSAELIFQYVENQGIPFENLEEQRSKKEEAIVYPKSDMENKRKEFIQDLELAQSYGQTDSSSENSKEVIVQIMENWFIWAKETENYGFFAQILDAFMDKIHKDAKVRENELNNDLAVYLEKNKEYENNEMTADVVDQIRGRIEQQNYAAAEDLLNRLIRNDLDPEEPAQQQVDYLQQFFDEYTINYKKTADSGTNLRLLLSSFRNNKDTKGANKLLESWPKGNRVGESSLRVLLNALGFDPDTVTAEPRLQGKIESYLVTLKRPQNGRKSNYKHPIAAFGSEAETKGFRVVCLFGKTDADRLIDTFKEIGNAKNTLVLLDYALSLGDRRKLARKTKTDLSGKIFAVLDRVAVFFLAKHYVETAVNRMLMYIIMPFASYQPYINKSADVMPPEIFIGRRYELEKIESPTGVNLVYGGRQLGKTALLRMAKKDIDKNENGDRAIIVDAREKDYRATAKAVSEALADEGILREENITEDWNVLARSIKNRLRDENHPIPYLLLMIDEADSFIESCDVVNYQPFDALKDIQSIGSERFKFVVAGLRNIVRFKQATVLKNNIGLVHLESLTVKPFKSMEARELLEVPLSYLGFRFPKDNETEVLISTIFGTTNYFPGLIQLYCTKMIEAIRRDYTGYSESDTPPYYVKKEHIKKVLAEQSLQEDIYDKFAITLKVDGDDYYYIIALLVAYHYHENRSSSGCDAQELMQLADAFSIRKITALDKEKLTALMEEMSELNVLQSTGDGCYRFTRHSFCQMMGTPEHIDDELMKYMED